MQSCWFKDINYDNHIIISLYQFDGAYRRPMDAIFEVVFYGWSNWSKLEGKVAPDMSYFQPVSEDSEPWSFTTKLHFLLSQGNFFYYRASGYLDFGSVTCSTLWTSYSVQVDTIIRSNWSVLFWKFPPSILFLSALSVIMND